MENLNKNSFFVPQRLVFKNGGPEQPSGKNPEESEKGVEKRGLLGAIEKSLEEEKGEGPVTEVMERKITEVQKRLTEKGIETKIKEGYLVNQSDVLIDANGHLVKYKNSPILVDDSGRLLDARGDRILKNEINGYIEEKKTPYIARALEKLEGFMEYNEGTWLQKAIMAAGEKKYPPNLYPSEEIQKSGGEVAWKKFQRAYVKKFPKGRKPTGEQIEEFQKEWAKQNLSIDLYTDAAKLKAEGEEIIKGLKRPVETVVEITKPPKDTEDVNFTNLFRGVRYELALFLGMKKPEFLTGDIVKDIYGAENFPRIGQKVWGSRKDSIMFNPRDGSLSFLISLNGKIKTANQITISGEETKDKIAELLHNDKNELFFPKEEKKTA